MKKNASSTRNHFKINYFGYSLEYFFLPGNWMDDQSLLKLKQNLDYVNVLSGKNYTHGVFEEMGINELRSLFKQLNVYIVKDQDEPIGFSFDMVLSFTHPKVVAAGLIISAKNKGVDLIRFPRIFLILNQYKLLKTHYYGVITSVPAVVGNFSAGMTNTWPSPNNKNQKKPPSKEYLYALNTIFKEYAERFFDDIELDSKRFVMTTKSDENDFELDFRKQPRDVNLKTNLFCMYWIDTSKGEDFILIGKVDWRSYLKNYFYILMLRIQNLLGK